MITIDDIYNGAERFISHIIREEMDAQGHTLTGTMSNSIRSRNKLNGPVKIMEGIAIEYTKFVNDGVDPKSASFKQAPFLIQYFIQRGFAPNQARQLAFATINKWKKEGMSTNASKRFSKNGSRQHAVENAFVAKSSEIDEYVGNSFDFYVDESYRSTKSETI